MDLGGRVGRYAHLGGALLFKKVKVRASFAESLQDDRELSWLANFQGGTKLPETDYTLLDSFGGRTTVGMSAAALMSRERNSNTI